MKWLTKAAVLLIILFEYSLSQNIYSSTATATVNMIKPLSISAINSTINFGEIILSGSSFVKNLDPSQGAVFKIEGHPNRNVIISYSYTTLSNAQWVSQYGGTVGTLSFLPDVVHTGSSSSYQLPKTITNGGSYQLINSGGIGVLYVWVGGSINIAANQPVGDYSGTFNIMVSY